MKKYKLTKYEQEILDAFNEDKLVDAPFDKKELQEAAHNTLDKIRKDKSISLRIAAKELETLKAKALEAGVPYQTIISTLIKQYNSEKIKITL